MIALACDHGGLEIKNAIIESLKSKGVEYIDLGTNTTDSVDYPIYAKALCKEMKYESCKFRERYTSKKGKNSTKIVRILNMEETIKNHIEFPDVQTLPLTHPLRLYMKYLTEWSSTEGQKKSNPDDAPDSLAMFAEEFIFKKQRNGVVKDLGEKFSSFL